MDQTYNIPLRKAFQKAPRYKKASKALREIKEFIKQHTKSDKIIIGKYLNQEVWKNGPKNPPAKVSVKVTKDGDKVKVELIGAPEEKKEEPIKEKKTKKELEKAPETKEEPKNKEEPIKEEKKEVKTKKVPTARELAAKKETKKKNS